MPRRIDIELTSALSDGSWTWRAAGARNPRGTVDGAILPAGASVGDELKVEVEQMLDGIEILSVVKGREKGARADLLELLPDDKPFEAVIETRAKRGGRDGGGRGRRDDRGEGRKRGRGRDDRRDDKRDDKRGDKREGGRSGRDDAPRGDSRGRSAKSDRPKRPHFEAPPEVPQRPKPKRLRAGSARRDAVLADVPEEQRPIAQLALQGMAAVRARVKEENAKLKEAGKPEMPEASVLKMAEELLPKLRVAEWLDRADAALRQMKQLDLRDLRSVVAASADSIVARDESTRELADELKAALVTKQAEEMSHWLEDVEAALSVGRVIRALRLSSQPPKAGVMFPPQLARRLGEAATASLVPEDSGERWAAVLEAAAFSPVRALVVPTTPPANVTDDLKKTALRLGPLLPQIAALLGVEVPKNAKRPKPLRPTSRKDAKKERGERRGGAARPARDGERAPRDRDDKRKGPRPPKDRPKGMRDISTVLKAAEEAEAAAAAEEAAAAEAAAAAEEAAKSEEPAKSEETAKSEEPAAPEEAAKSEEPAAPEEPATTDADDGRPTGADGDSAGSGPASDAPDSTSDAADESEPATESA